MSRRRFLLYSTRDCSLCDQALDLLLALDVLGGHELLVIDITHDDELFERFGEMIPVLESDGQTFTGAFEAETVSAWVSSQIS